MKKKKSGMSALLLRFSNSAAPCTVCPAQRRNAAKGRARPRRPPAQCLARPFLTHSLTVVPKHCSPVTRTRWPLWRPCTARAHTQIWAPVPQHARRELRPVGRACLRQPPFAPRQTRHTAAVMEAAALHRCGRRLRRRRHHPALMGIRPACTVTLTTGMAAVSRRRQRDRRRHRRPRPLAVAAAKLGSRRRWGHLRRARRRRPPPAPPAAVVAADAI